MTEKALPQRYLSPALDDQDWRCLGGPSLRDVELAIYAGVWSGVVTGRLPPGHKLDEAVLCDIYGVSRTVVRRVLYMLEEQGIAALLPNRGAWVASPTREEAFELAEIIEINLSHIASSLAARAHSITKGERDRLTRHLAAEDVANEHSNWPACRRLRMDFGTLLMFIHGNRALAAAWQRDAMRFLVALSLHQSMWNVIEEARFTKVLINHILEGSGAEVRRHIRGYMAGLSHSFRVDPTIGVNLKAVLGRLG